MFKRILLPICAFLFALTPFLSTVQSFRKLFFFGDELVSLNEMRVHGFFPWVLSVFAESSVPVFKFVWGGAVIAFGGSYFALEVVVWMVHAANAVLLCLILSRMAAGTLTRLLGISLFAVTPGTHETLGWTIQLCPVLASTFLLLGLYLLVSERPSRYKVLGASLCSLLAAFSFARGVVVCGVLSVGLYMVVRPRSWREWVGASLPLLPALAAALIIFLWSDGNHQHVVQVDSEKIAKVVSFAGTFYLLNPLYRIFFDSPPGIIDFLVFGAVKVCVVGVSLALGWRTRDPITRLLLVLPVLFDLGNALLLGVGRYHTGWVFALSSRYQYESLICLAIPVVALLGRVTLLPRLSQVSGSIALVLLIGFSLHRWIDLMPHWAEYRGSAGRRFFFGTSRGNPPTEWIGLPGILPKDQALATIEEYKLH